MYLSFFAFFLYYYFTHSFTWSKAKTENEGKNTDHTKVGNPRAGLLWGKNTRQASVNLHKYLNIEITNFMPFFNIT